MTDAERIAQLEQRIASLEALLSPANVNLHSTAQRLLAGDRTEPSRDPDEALTFAEKFQLVWQSSTALRQLHSRIRELERARFSDCGLLHMPEWLLTSAEAKLLAERREADSKLAKQHAENEKFNAQARREARERAERVFA